MVIKLGSSPENVPFPEPATTFGERGVSKCDWSTFMNYLFPIHSLASGGTSGDLKVSCDEKSVSGSVATSRSPTSDPSTAITLNSQNIDEAVQHRVKLQITIEEWNTFFFLPRGLLLAKIETPATSKSALDANSRDISSTNNALCEVVKQGNESTARTLTLRGADPNSKPYGGEPPIYIAAQKRA
jgi:hypothetical protein